MPSMLRPFTLAILAVTLLTVAAPDADAANRKARTQTSKKRVTNKMSMAAGTRDARYADIIMNPSTGEIYHQTDADGIRYPASLTKMMTLYLLFEALEQRKTTLGARMDVSEYAASMPQTNLHLEEGDSIPVEIAIKALVVRSANDVAVVVGEALGGDTERFAQMMTAKARALGMRNTIFKNANGLPNNGQHTTARDMAKLGIALKRDFPKYYPYFATRQFSWNGATYYTHNRVMLRYAGTDGIKTGFIGLSGFNLVSSVTRGGRPLVGTVMGGTTGAWRDNRMIQLLDQSYGVIAERGAVRGRMYPENLPLPKNGGKIGTGLSAQVVEASELAAARAASADADEPLDTAPEEDGDVQPLVPTAAEVAARTPKEKNQPVAVQQPVVVPQPVVVSTPATVNTTVSTPNGPIVMKLVPPAPKPAVAPATAATSLTPPPAVTYVNPATAPVAQTAPAIAATNAPAAAPVTKPAVSLTLTPPKASDSVVRVSLGGSWGIQVGAFSSNALADVAVKQARQLAQPSLLDAREAIAGPEVNGPQVYRARLINLSEKQAKSACEQLISNNTPCFIYKAN